MEVKPGYKQTDAGLIPQEWDAVLAGSIGRFRGGNGFPLALQGETAGDYPFFKVSDMNNEGNETFMVSSNNWISEDTRKQIGATLFPSGSIVFAKVGAAVFLERKKILSQPSCIDNNMAGYILDERRADIRFVHTQLLRKRLGSLVATTALPALNGKQLGEMALVLPPLPEQRAIADALSDVDRLLGGLDQLIAKKRDLKQAAMQQLLTGQTRLPGFHGEWDMKSLFALAEHKKELFDDGDWIEAEFLTENGVRLVQTGNIGEGHFADKQDRKYISEESFKKLRCKALEIGDILICRLAEPAGRACILPDVGEVKLITAVDVTIFRPPASVADRRFLVNAFNTRRWFQTVNARCGGSTRTRIARGQLGKIEITLPSLPEQTAIAEVLTEFDTELAALERRREKTRDLKQAMMQELLTGKTRLV